MSGAGGGAAVASAPARLSPLELAAGMPLAGPGAVPEGPAAAGGERAPVAALEAAIVPALERGPCLVAFSGGRDSSALLAVAVAAARRRGLAEPVAATLRFGTAASEESRWQEQVVRQLGLGEWERIEAGGRLGLLGPVAREGLARHGLLWPPNIHTLAPMLEAARGGTLLSGLGGDELLGGWRYARLDAALHGRARPGRSELRLAARALAPRALLRRRLLRRASRERRLGWLAAAAQAELDSARIEAELGEPVRWRAWVDWLLRSVPYLAAIEAAARVLAADRGARVAFPLLDPGFAAALAGLGGRRRGERAALMRELFGGLLPEAVLARREKADFTEAVWDEGTRSLAGRCLEGLPAPVAALCDREALAAEWRSPRPDFRSATLLQLGWLEGDAC